jgi:tetratricopeptide (TPR) repeat protein
VNLSYALDAGIWGLRPLGFHITNSLLHALNVLLVFLIGRAVVSDTRGGSNEDAKASPPVPSSLPIVAAALLAVHPMMSQAVGYVSARADVLCATFVLTAFLLARRFLAGGAPGWAAAAICAWCLALGSKEVAAMFPFALLAYHALVLPVPAGRRRAGALYVPMLVLMLAAVLARLWILRQVEYESAPLDWRLGLVAVDALWRYLGLLLWPAGQTVFHALTAIESPLDPLALRALALLLGAAGAAWWLRRVDRAITFGLIWFLLFLLPSCALFILGRGEALAEHRAYLSSVGVFLSAGALFAALSRWSRSEAPTLRWVVVALTTVVLFQLAARTIIRNAVWSNPVRLWQEALDKAPDHWLPHMMHGEALRLAGGCRDAVPEYQLTIRLRPQEAFAWGKLGSCFVDLGRYDEAGEVFDHLIRMAPTSPDGPIGMAIVAVMKGRHDVARDALIEAIRRDPSSVTARQLLLTLEAPTNPGRALALCQEPKELAPATGGLDQCIANDRRRLEAPTP